eukprot:11457519-Alexandrium_andersonii.AAC.1
MSLEVWRTMPDDDCPFDRDPPIETGERDISDTGSPQCSLAVAWTWWNSLSCSDEEWINAEWG